jgi:hypothetical protein
VRQGRDGSAKKRKAEVPSRAIKDSPQSRGISAMVRVAAMSALTFRCPTTGEEIDPGIEDLDPAAETLRFSALYVRCCHCGEHHEIKIDEAALTEAA